MPKNPNLKSVLIIGSGPIVIGQACEFDYSGTQALRSLREDGIETILINSNPATIMTDPSMADHVYLLPLTTKSLVKILKEHPQIDRSEEHTSELQSRPHLVCRLLLEKKKRMYNPTLLESDA